MNSHIHFSIDELIKEVQRLKEKNAQLEEDFIKQSKINEELTHQNQYLNEKCSQLSEALELFIEVCDTKPTKVKNRDPNNGQFLPLKRERENDETEDPNLYHNTIQFNDTFEENKHIEVEEKREQKKAKRAKREVEERKPKERERRTHFTQKEFTKSLGEKFWKLMSDVPCDYDAIKEFLRKGLEGGNTKFLNHTKNTSISNKGPAYKTTPLDEVIYEHHARLLQLLDKLGALKLMETAYYSTPERQLETEYVEYLDFLQNLEAAKEKRLLEKNRYIERNASFQLYKEKSLEEKKKIEARREEIASYTSICVCGLRIVDLNEVVPHRTQCEKYLKKEKRRANRHAILLCSLFTKVLIFCDSSCLS